MCFINNLRTITRVTLPTGLSGNIFTRKFNFFNTSPNIPPNPIDITLLTTNLEQEIDTATASAQHVAIIDNTNSTTNRGIDFPIFNNLKKIMHWQHFKQILKVRNNTSTHNSTAILENPVERVINKCNQQASIWSSTNFDYQTSNIVTHNDITSGNNKDKIVKVIDDKIYSLTLEIKKETINYKNFTKNDLKSLLGTLYSSTSSPAKIIALTTMLKFYYTGGSVSAFLERVDSQENYNFTYKNQSRQIDKIEVINEIKNLSTEEHQLLFKFALHQQRALRLFTMNEFIHKARNIILHQLDIKKQTLGATADGITSRPTQTAPIIIDEHDFSTPSSTPSSNSTLTTKQHDFTIHDDSSTPNETQLPNHDESTLAKAPDCNLLSTAPLPPDEAVDPNQYIITDIKEKIKEFNKSNTDKLITPHTSLTSTKWRSPYLMSDLTSDEFELQTGLKRGVYRTSDNKHFQVIEKEIRELALMDASQNMSGYENNKEIPNDICATLFEGYITPKQTMRDVYDNNKKNIKIKKLIFTNKKGIIQCLSHNKSAPLDYTKLLLNAKNNPEFLLLLMIVDPNIHNMPHKNLINLQLGVEFINAQSVVIDLNSHKIFLQSMIRCSNGSNIKTHILLTECKFKYTKFLLNELPKQDFDTQNNTPETRRNSSAYAKAAELTKEYTLNNIFEFENLQFQLLDEIEYENHMETHVGNLYDTKDILKSRAHRTSILNTKHHKPK